MNQTATSCSSPPTISTKGEFFHLLFCGFLMGAADLVPGISGGTIAFLMGFYAPFLESIQSFNQQSLFSLVTFRWKRLKSQVAWQFLGTILLGISLAVLLLAQVVRWLLYHEIYHSLLFAGFFGLVLASAWHCSKRIPQWFLRHYGTLALGILIALLLTGKWVDLRETSGEFHVPLPQTINTSQWKDSVNLDKEQGLLLRVDRASLAAMRAKGLLDEKSQVFSSSQNTWISVSSLKIDNAWETRHLWLFTCGIIGVSAMLLPGISGSYLLKLLGAYSIVIGALADLSWELSRGQIAWEGIHTLSSLFLGMLVGIVCFSRVLRWFLDHYEHIATALLVGFMLGAIHVLWPFWETSYELIPHKLHLGPRLLLLHPIWPQEFGGLFFCAVLVGTVSFFLVKMIEK